jgi:hypothetical protein
VDNHLDVEIQQRLEIEWARYAHAALCGDAHRHGGDGAAPSAARATTKLIGLERDEYDLPILPPLNPNIKTDDINTLIRSYLGIHYGKHGAKICAIWLICST